MGSLKMGVGAQRDREDTPSRHLGIMATSGKAVWVIKAPNEDPNQGTRVQRPLAARMLAPCRGGPRHTAAQAPWTVCGRTRLHSIRGNSLPSWAKHARCRSCCQGAYIIKKSTVHLCPILTGLIICVLFSQGKTFVSYSHRATLLCPILTGQHFCVLFSQG